MARKSFTDKDRARIFASNNGCCHLCNGKIDGVREAWEIEHVIAWELTRDDSDENLRPAHKHCHAVKTHTQDRPAINQAKRREAKFTGVKRPKGTIASPPKPPKASPKFDMTKRRNPYTHEVIR
ncbi:HNH endonuclease signature motif containing protein [Corticibacterium sp. UT-5YL-CI-8]|nr:HNH endonuclease signature motif containing protein [Tianweitania sp. UT-5YL-CI-8]